MRVDFFLGETHIPQFAGHDLELEVSKYLVELIISKWGEIFFASVQQQVQCLQALLECGVQCLKSSSCWRQGASNNTAKWEVEEIPIPKQLTLAPAIMPPTKGDWLVFQTWFFSRCFVTVWSNTFSSRVCSSWLMTFGGASKVTASRWLVIQLTTPPEIRPYDSGLVNQLVSLNKTLRCGEGGVGCPCHEPKTSRAGSWNVPVHHLAIPVKTWPLQWLSSWPSNDPGDQAGIIWRLFFSKEQCSSKNTNLWPMKHDILVGEWWDLVFFC